MSWLHRVTTRLVAAFAVPLVVLCVVGALAYRNTDHLERNSADVDHTYQVLGAIEKVNSALRDAETGQRGFLITGAEKYLEPYTAATRSIDGLIDALAALTVDNAAQQQRIAGLRTQVAAKFDEMAGTIELRREMARNVNEASLGSRSVSGSLATVSTAVSATSTAIDSSEQAVAELARMSSTLHGLVGQFKY
jgi:methyl-accepting chemotaxis protein